jgi:signal transduction histidine kinase
LDSAYQGEEGVALAQRARHEGHDYQMAFVDVRMPPGLDGIETTRKLWEINPDLQVVICTAYSDYSWAQMVEKLGRSDRLVLLKKPFDTLEVVQLANTLTEKWHLLQLTHQKMDELEQIVHYRTLHLKKINGQLEQEVNARKRRELCLRLQQDVTRALADSTDSPSQVTEKILQLVCERMGWDVGEFWSLERQTQLLRVTASWHRAKPKLAEFKTASQKLAFGRGQGVPGRVWATGKSVWVPDASGDTDTSVAVLTKVSQLRAAFAFPVQVGSEMLGVLSFLGANIREPEADIAEMFATMSNLIGQSLDRHRLEEQLRQSQKMDAIGRLAGGVAHDFNNVLTVIQGYVEIIQMNRSLESETVDGLNQILASAQRAASLTRQLLTFSRRQVMQPKAADLNLIVGNLTKMLRRLIGEDVELGIAYDPNPTMVEVDENMIGQIMMNITVNARDAMPRGGKLSISTDNVAIGEDEARECPDRRTGQFIRLTIRDTGCGIEPENLPRIFEPFYTTKEVGRGTGLGLATVFGIVAQHHGWIEVESKVGVGTTFRVFLPRASVGNATEASDSGDASLPGGTETILLVEDEAPVRRLARSFLERLGYTVLEAETGVQALALWDKQGDNVNLVLTDVIMPEGMTGRDLIKRLQARRPQLKYLLTSGYTFDHEHEGEPLIEGQNFLQKPYHPRVLAQTVRSCLGRRPDGCQRTVSRAG